MSLSNKASPKQGDAKGPDGAYAAWGLIIAGGVTLIPALFMGGRMYAVALFAAVAGWLIGAVIDRAQHKP